MKRNTVLAGLFCMTMMCFAQNNAAIQKIRERYASAQERIKVMLDEKNAANYATTSMTKVIPAIGPVAKTFECYAYDASGEEETTPDFRPFFIRTKMDATPTALGVSYDEFLFNDKDGTLIFYYHKGSGYWAEDEVWGENRDYFDNNGKFITNNFKLTSRETGQVYPSDCFESDKGEGGKKLAKQLFEAFTIIMNY